MMRHMLKLLTDLGASAKEETESLRILSEQAQDDARLIKILTFIAMLYLPASLVAVSLVTSLRQHIHTYVLYC
jgi:hypothetical protein